VERGLLGPREVPRLWERHILNSAVVTELIPGPCTVVDLGSGAGLPGILIAMLMPGCQVTLVESSLRRAVFLEEAVAALDLPNASVRRSRAEDLAGELTADVVTARAVARLPALAEWSLGLLRPGGLVLAIKGESAAAELAAARQALRRLGARDTAISHVGSGKVDPATTVVSFIKEPVMG